MGRKGYRLTHQAAFTAIEQWCRIGHPNIVTVHEAFTTRSFGDSCMDPSLPVVYSSVLNWPSSRRGIRIPPQRAHTLRCSYQA